MINVLWVVILMHQKYIQKKMEYTLLMLLASKLIRMEQWKKIRGARFLCISYFTIHNSFPLVGFLFRLCYKNAAVIPKLQQYTFSKDLFLSNQNTGYLGVSPQEISVRLFCLIHFGCFCLIAVGAFKIFKYQVNGTY